MEKLSLLHNLPYSDYKTALTLSVEDCERIARHADLRISFTKNQPGEQLVKALDRAGYSYQQYTKLMNTAPIFYQPQTKIAIMIASERYIHLTHLGTPVCDCELLGQILSNLGFVVLTVKNSTSLELKDCLRNVFEMIPEDSYCLIFYAGHGCQISNTQCMLTVDCPTEDLELQHCVTENFILREIEKRKPELVVLIMDMCRVYLDRIANPKIFASMPSVEEYTIHRNLLISYSAQSSQTAYEIIQLECSASFDVDSNATYELQSGDLDNIVPSGSQYAQVLSERLDEPTDISRILDKVHTDIQKSKKKQTPIKVQCGMDKRSLHDPSIGDSVSLKAKILQYIENKAVKECPESRLDFDLKDGS